MAHVTLKPSILGSLSLALCFAAAGSDWPQWRGPNRDGKSTETGLLKSWPAQGPTLTWTAQNLGKGYSGVTVAGDHLFTMGDLKDANYVFALNRADGRPLWSAKVGKTGAPGWGNYAGPRCSVTVGEDRVFGLGQYGELVCLDRSTGRELWRKHYVQDFKGPRPEWGYSESPLLDGNRLICTPGGDQGAILALDPKTGEILWRCRQFTDPAHYSSLVIAQVGGVRQYVQLTAKHVAGVDAEDGRLLWQAARKGKTAVIPTPIIIDSHVYVTSSYDIGCNLFKITRTGDTFQAEQVYANETMANHHGGVVQVGPHLYGHSEGKGWTCQDWATGQALWQEKSKLGKGSITYADGALYLRAEAGKGTVALVKATPEGYRELARFDQPQRSEQESWPHPVIANGRLYLRDQEILLCYDVKE